MKHAFFSLISQLISEIDILFFCDWLSKYFATNQQNACFFIGISWLIFETHAFSFFFFNWFCKYAIQQNSCFLFFFPFQFSRFSHFLFLRCAIISWHNLAKLMLLSEECSIMEDFLLLILKTGNWLCGCNYFTENL